MDGGEIEMIDGKQVAENDSIFVDGTCEMRTNSPVRQQALIVRGLRRDVFTRLRVIGPGENAEDRVGVADIDD